MHLLYLQRDVSRLLKAGQGAGVLTAAQQTTLGDARTHINELLENVPWWLMALSATFLGLGTAIGYKRIVVTLGEWMSSVKMNAAHGTAVLRLHGRERRLQHRYLGCSLHCHVPVRRWCQPVRTLPELRRGLDSRSVRLH